MQIECKLLHFLMILSDVHAIIREKSGLMDISAAKQEFFIAKASQKKEPGGHDGKKRYAMGYALEYNSSTNPRKRHNTSQNSDQLPHHAKVLKARKMSKPAAVHTASLHGQIFTDLTAKPRQGKGEEIFGDFWDAFKSILDAFSNQYQGRDSPINEEKILAEWMPGRGLNRDTDRKLVKIAWDNRFHKITTINYLWDQAKNILLRGLNEGEKHFFYETEYRTGKKPITAWECLDIFLTQYISRKEWKVSARFLREKLILSLQDPRPTEADKEKICIKHCDQFLKPEDIDSKGKLLFDKSQWSEIVKLIATSYKDYKPSQQEIITPNVHDIFHQALKDFVQIMPEMPGPDEIEDLHPETGEPIRRTVATTEFNISSRANKLNSEQTFARLIYPLVHAEKYGLTKQDIEKYEFLLAAVMNLKHYHFIVVDFRNTRKKEFGSEELWKIEHRYHSIFPFLLAFKPGVSSIPSGEDPEIGEDIDYDALKTCFSSEKEKPKYHKKNKAKQSIKNSEPDEQKKELNENQKLIESLRQSEEKLQEARQLLAKKEEEAKEKLTLTKANYYLTEEIKQSKESVISLECRVTSLTETIRILEEKLGSFEEAQKNIEEQCKKNISDICPPQKETETETEIKEAENQELSNRLRAIKKMVESICLIKREKQLEVSNLQQKLTEKAKSFKDTLANRETKIKKLEAELKLARAETEASKDILFESKEKTEELKSHYQNEIKIKTKEIKELKENYSKEKKYLEEKINNLIKQEKSNQDKLINLKQDLHETNIKLKINNDTLYQGLMNKITESSKKAKAKEKELKDKEDELTYLKDQITEYRINSEQLTGKVNTLENNIKTLKKEKELFCQLLRESEKQDKKIKLESEITHLNLKKELLDSKERVKVYESDLKTMKDKQSSLLSELENVRSKLASKESKESEQLLKKKKLEDSLEVSKASILQLQTEVSTLKEHKDSLSTENKKLNTWLTEVRSELEHSRLAEEAVAQDLNHVKDTVISQEEIIEKIRKESNHTQDELNRAQANFEKSSAQAENSHKEACRLRDQVASLEQVKARLEDDLTKSQTSLTNYQQKLLDCQHQQSTLQSENSQLKDQNKHFTEQQAALLEKDQQLEQLQRQFIYTKDLANTKCRKVEELKKEVNDLKTNAPEINQTVNQQFNIQMTPNQLLNYQRRMETLLRQKDMTIDLFREMLAANAQAAKSMNTPAQESTGLTSNNHKSQHKRLALNTSILPFPELDTPTLHTPGVDTWNFDFDSIPLLFGITTDLDNDNDNIVSSEPSFNAPEHTNPHCQNADDNC